LVIETSAIAALVVCGEVGIWGGYELAVEPSVVPLLTTVSREAALRELLAMQRRKGGAGASKSAPSVFV
jgi:hypothetical protein